MSADSEMLPPPNDPEDFEGLCLDLWRDIWKDPNAQKNGRKGQRQAGVDVFGLRQGDWIGVQCKQKDGLLRYQLTVAELDQEVKAAGAFRPSLSEFILATSGPAEAKVQRRARELTNQHAMSGGFSVSVWSWREIWQEIFARPTLLARIGPIYWQGVWRATRQPNNAHAFLAKMAEQSHDIVNEQIRFASQGKYDPQLYVRRAAEEQVTRFASFHNAAQARAIAIITLLKQIATEFSMGDSVGPLLTISNEELTPAFIAQSEHWLQQLQTGFCYHDVQLDIQSIIDLPKAVHSAAMAHLPRNIVQSIRARSYSRSLPPVAEMAAVLAKFLRESLVNNETTSLAMWAEDIMPWFPSAKDPTHGGNRRLANEFINELRQLFANAAKRCFAVVDAAGTGKTNLLCNFARTIAPQHPVLFLTGHLATISTGRDLNYCLQGHMEKFVGPADFSWAELDAALGSRKQWLYVVIDGVNEHEDLRRLVSYIRAFLTEHEMRHIKLILSCRDLFWDLLRPAIQLSLFSGTSVALGEFSGPERIDAFQRYAARFAVRGQVPTELLSKLARPSLLRFFCRAHQNRQITATESADFGAVFALYLGDMDDALRLRMQHLGPPPLWPFLLRLADALWRGRTMSVTLRQLEVSPEEHKIPDSLYNLICSEGLLVEIDRPSNVIETKVRFVFDELMEYVLAEYWKAKLVEADSGSAEIQLVAEIIDAVSSFPPALGGLVNLDRRMRNDGRILAQAISHMFHSRDRFAARRQTAMLYLFENIESAHIDEATLSALVSFEGDAWPDIKTRLAPVMLAAVRQHPDHSGSKAILETLLEAKRAPVRSLVPHSASNQADPIQLSNTLRQYAKVASAFSTTYGSNNADQLPSARFHYPDDVRLNAISVLIAGRSEWCMGLVDEGIENLGEMELHSALRALEACDLAENKHVFDIVDKNMRLPQPEYRIYCAWLLRERYGLRPAEYLVRLLTDHETRVHRYVVRMFETRRVENELIARILTQLSDAGLRPWHRRNLLRVLSMAGAHTAASSLEQHAGDIRRSLVAIARSESSHTRGEAFTTMFNLPAVFDRRYVLESMRSDNARHIQALALRLQKSEE